MSSTEVRWRSGERAALSGLALVAVTLLSSACASPERTRPSPATLGVASWYGPGFHGKATTSGEIYDQEAMTAAHPSWPLGTRVRVTNLDNGKSTEVRLNDRGPFVGGRAIDLSYAAARALEMVGPGTCRVKLQPILAPGTSLGTVQFAIQVAAFGDEARAQEVRQRLDGTLASVPARVERRPAYVVTADSSAGRVWRVRVGPYRARAEAESSAAELAAAGYAPVIVEEIADQR